MKKIVLALIIIGVQFLNTGCDMLKDGDNGVAETKTVPCLEADVKDVKTETQAWNPGITTDLTVNVNGTNTKIADVTVYTVCGGCWVFVSNVAECWKLNDIRVWVGKNIIDLKNISANPAQFSDLDIYEVGVGTNYIIYPYQSGWYCNDNLNFAVWANAQDTCDEHCGEETPVSATLCTQNIYDNVTSQDKGDVVVKVNNSNLEVSYSFTNGYTLEYAHLEIVNNLSDIPAAPITHLPYPLLFDYHHNGSYFQNNKFVIPLSELKTKFNYQCGVTPLYLMMNIKGVKFLSYTAGYVGPTKWYNTYGRYFQVTIPCPTVHTCDYDAWGKGTDNQKFTNIGLSKFGWYFQCPIDCE